MDFKDSCSNKKVYFDSIGPEIFEVTLCLKVHCHLILLPWSQGHWWLSDGHHNPPLDFSTECDTVGTHPYNMNSLWILGLSGSWLSPYGLVNSWFPFLFYKSYQMSHWHILVHVLKRELQFPHSSWNFFWLVCSISIYVTVIHPIT